MGQVTSNECECRETFLHMCLPDEPHNDTQNTLEVNVPHARPQAPPVHPLHAALSESGHDAVGGLGGQLNPNLAEQVNAFTFASDEGAEVFAAPPPSGRSYASSPNRQQINRSPQRVPDFAAATLGSTPMDVTVDDILSNLDGSEEVLYGTAFATFHGGRNGWIGMDSSTMRDFICTNTCISMEDIDMELLKVASSEEGLSLNDFLVLLREFPISEGEAIMQFMGMSADGESLVSQECRSALLLFMQQAFATNFSDDWWDRIFNTVMWDAGVTVSMEQWLIYCKLTARIVRLLRYVQIQKASANPYSSRGRPVRGGA